MLGKRDKTWHRLPVQSCGHSSMVKTCMLLEFMSSSTSASLFHANTLSESNGGETIALLFHANTLGEPNGGETTLQVGTVEIFAGI